MNVSTCCARWEPYTERYIFNTNNIHKNQNPESKRFVPMETALQYGQEDSSMLSIYSRWPGMATNGNSQMMHMPLTTSQRGTTAVTGEPERSFVFTKPS